MCEVTEPCARRNTFHVHVETVPQPLGPDGAYGMERNPAGRSILACAGHLPRAVREMSALPIRTGKLPTVAPFDGKRT